MKSDRVVAVLLVLGLACTTGTQEQGVSTSSGAHQPVASRTSASALPAASPPRASVPCSSAAPSLPVATVDSQAFVSVLKTKRRLDVLAVQGRLLFAGTSRAVTPHGPGDAYVNRLHELDGETIRPAAGLQRGIWTDFALWSAWGHWPDTVLMVGTNFGNTAWEQVGFQWSSTKGEWIDWKPSRPTEWGWGSPWAWTNDASSANGSVSASSPVGIPKDLCDGEESCGWSLAVVAPRDVYTTTAGCERGGGPACVTTRMLHWCAPRPRFEVSMAPRPLPHANVIAVPGTALVYGGKPDAESTFEDGFMFRDGVWTPVELPEATFRREWLTTSGGFIWYLGEDGPRRLGEGGFARVAAWRRAYGNDKIAKNMGTIMGRSTVTLPGASGPAALTGFLARSAEELWLTTWNGKETEVWSTSRRALKWED